MDAAIGAKKMKTQITVAELKQLISYDPDTGVFTRISGKRPGVKVGHVDEKGYIRILIKGRRMRANRLAWLYMTGEMPEALVDHENQNKADNCWGNLREATRSQNAINAGLKRTNKHGAKGVSTANGKYVAYIMVDKKAMHLGRYDTLDEAAHAYNKAAIQHFGEFAVLNPVGA